MKVFVLASQVSVEKAFQIPSPTTAQRITLSVIQNFPAKHLLKTVEWNWKPDDFTVQLVVDIPPDSGVIMLNLFVDGEIAGKQPIPVEEFLKDRPGDDLLLAHTFALSATLALTCVAISVHGTSDSVPLDLMQSALHQSLSLSLGFAVTRAVKLLNEEIRLALEDSVMIEAKCESTLAEKEAEIEMLQSMLVEQQLLHQHSSAAQNGLKSHGDPLVPGATNGSSGTHTRGIERDSAQSKTPTVLTSGSSGSNEGAMNTSTISISSARPSTASTPRLSTASEPMKRDILKQRALQLERKEMEIRVLRERISDLDAYIHHTIVNEVKSSPTNTGSGAGNGKGSGNGGGSTARQASPYKTTPPRRAPSPVGPKKAVSPPPTTQPPAGIPNGSATPRRPPSTSTRTPTPPRSTFTLGSAASSPSLRLTPSSASKSSLSQIPEKLKREDSRYQRIEQMEATLQRLRNHRELQLKREGFYASQAPSSSPAIMRKAESTNAEKVMPPMRRVSPMKVVDRVSELNNPSRRNGSPSAASSTPRRPPSSGGTPLKRAERSPLQRGSALTFPAR